MMFQTLLARAASKRIRVNIDPASSKSLQEEAEIKGEMGAYEHILSLFTDTDAPAVEDENKPETTPTIVTSIQPTGV